MLNCAISLATTGAFAALEGTTPYSDVWATGDNGGTLGSFLPWGLTNNGGGGFAGYFIGDSTIGSGDLNTGGVSFGLFANPTGVFADANHNFVAPLLLGQTFSLNVGVDFRNGNKGFSLFQGATEISISTLVATITKSTGLARAWASFPTPFSVFPSRNRR